MKLKCLFGKHEPLFKNQRTTDITIDLKSVEEKHSNFIAWTNEVHGNVEICRYCRCLYFAGHFRCLYSEAEIVDILRKPLPSERVVSSTSLLKTIQDAVFPSCHLLSRAPMNHEFTHSWYAEEPHNNLPKDDSELERLRAFAQATKVRDEWIEKSTKLTLKHGKTNDEQIESTKSWDQVSKAKWIYLKRFDEVFGTNKLQDVFDWMGSYAGSGDEWVDDVECVRAILNNEQF